jgi:hypothetical protein
MRACGRALVWPGFVQAFLSLQACSLLRSFSLFSLCVCVLSCPVSCLTPAAGSSPIARRSSLITHRPSPPPAASSPPSSKPPSPHRAEREKGGIPAGVSCVSVSPALSLARRFFALTSLILLLYHC